MQMQFARIRWGLERAHVSLAIVEMELIVAILMSAMLAMADVMQTRIAPIQLGAEFVPVIQVSKVNIFSL